MGSVVNTIVLEAKHFKSKGHTKNEAGTLCGGMGTQEQIQEALDRVYENKEILVPTKVKTVREKHLETRAKK
jgi:hypothetical protein